MGRAISRLDGADQSFDVSWHEPKRVMGLVKFVMEASYYMPEMELAPGRRRWERTSPLGTIPGSRVLTCLGPCCRQFQPRAERFHMSATTLSADKGTRRMGFRFRLGVRQWYEITFNLPDYSVAQSNCRICLSKTKRDVHRSGNLHSTTDLSRSLIRYIKQYKQRPPHLPLEI